MTLHVVTRPLLIIWGSDGHFTTAVLRLFTHFEKQFLEAGLPWGWSQTMDIWSVRGSLMCSFRVHAGGWEESKAALFGLEPAVCLTEGNK